LLDHGRIAATGSHDVRRREVTLDDVFFSLTGPRRQAGTARPLSSLR